MRISPILCLAVIGLLLGGCGGSGRGGDDDAVPASRSTPTPASVLRLKNFSTSDSCAEFLGYAATALTEQYLQPFYSCSADGLRPCPIFLGPPEAVNAAPAAPATDGAQPDRVSGTHTQEAGVDEADVVKADAAGNLYILNGRHLYVLDAFPPAGLATQPLADLPLAGDDAGFFATDFFLDEAAQRLVVLGQSYGAQGGEVVNVIVDISDPAQPTEVQRLRHTGYALEARRVGARVHRVARFDVPLPGWFSDADDPLVQQRQDYLDAQAREDQAESDRIRAATRAEIEKRLQDAGAAALLPQLSDAAGTRALGCGDVARPDVAAGLGLVVIDSFDSDGSTRAASAAVNNSWLVYGSADNLYLAQSSFGWRFAPTQAEETAVYRFALDPQGPARYQGLGKVPGSVIGRFAFSEFEGHLRVASTETRFTDDSSTSTFNHLHVLRADQAQSDLPVVGSVRDYAPGERIQGARFVGRRGFVVTFRQIDPLFAFDLTEPARPVIASALKIPGFSSFLAPLGEDYLLTVGREGDDAGLSGRMQVSLFDVRDLANVSQISTLVPANQPTGSYSYSSAEYDPHAFTYFPDSVAAAAPGRLALPLQIYGDTPEQQFSGFLLLRVNPLAATAEERLAELGRIDHQSLAADRACADEGSERCSEAVYAADPRRSLFMEDAFGTYLYTVSTSGVLASDANDPDTALGQRVLPYDPSPYDCCVTIGDSGSDGGTGGDGGSGGGSVPPARSPEP